MKRTIVIAVILAIATLFLSSCGEGPLTVHSIAQAPTSQNQDIPTPPASNPDDGQPANPSPTGGTDSEEPGEPTPQTPEDNIFVLMRAPYDYEATCVILDGTYHSPKAVTLCPTPVEVFSWHQTEFGATQVLSVEYTDAEGEPMRFSFCPSDSDYLAVLRRNAEADRVTYFTIDLYTNDVTVN